MKNKINPPKDNKYFKILQERKKKQQMQVQQAPQIDISTKIEAKPIEKPKLSKLNIEEIEKMKNGLFNISNKSQSFNLIENENDLTQVKEYLYSEERVNNNMVDSINKENENFINIKSLPSFNHNKKEIEEIRIKGRPTVTSKKDLSYKLRFVNNSFEEF